MIQKRIMAGNKRLPWKQKKASPIKDSLKSWLNISANMRGAELKDLIIPLKIFLLITWKKHYQSNVKSCRDDIMIKYQKFTHKDIKIRDALKNLELEVL